jgi:hypothetical protein
LPTQNLSGYAVGGGAATGTASSDDKDEKGYWAHSRLKRAYNDYLNSKREEIDEQQDARRFVHGSQWTSEQLKQLELRKQPASWENITARKIHGVVGTLERLKQDPKAFPRTPKHEAGAELATAALNYALDAEDWSSKDPICSEMAAIDGVGGIEFGLEQGDQGDVEISLAPVYMDSFFYDPRSFLHDFSDARYMGVAKWMDLDAAIELYPDHEEELENSLSSGEDLTSSSDRDNRWFNTEGDNKQLRLVEIWYKMRGVWCWCVFTGSAKIQEGKSPFKDEKGKSEHKYEMFSCYVDQDGDRYGLVRNLKPLNLAVNMCKSKAYYTALSRRILAPKGTFDDVEVARREASRSDGVVEYNPQGDAKPEFDDMGARGVLESMFKFYEMDKTALESFGPNVAVTGQGLENSSGRAIHLLQQAGLADLGPFLQSYRGWKIRIYRKMWNAIQHHWTGERWIRVTDDDDLSQFIQINGVQVDPNTGQPTLVNSIGSLDVDIVLDEGPDNVTQMAGGYDTLETMAKAGAQVPPAVLIELNPYIPLWQKKKVLEMLNPSQPDPKQEAREQLEFKNAAAVVAQTEADAMLKQAQAQKTMAEASVVQPEQPEMGQPGDHPMKVQSEAIEKQAAAEQKIADAEKKRAETAKIIQDIQLEPQRMAMEYQAQQQEQAMKAEQARATFHQQAQDSERNYEVNKMKAKQKPQGKAK